VYSALVPLYSTSCRSTPTHDLTSMVDDGRLCASPYVRLAPCTLVFTNGYHLLQDEVSSLFTRYGQAMLKKIRNGSVNPGTNGSAADSPEHDCLSWLAPTGQLEGPNRDCTRPLRAVVNKAVEKCVGKIDYGASGWSQKRREVRAALRKGLRTRCNRRRASARLLAYRILGVYLDADVKEATLERVVLAGSVNDTAQAAVPAALGSASSIGYRLKLQDGDQEMERPLDLNGAAASIVGELLFLDPSEVWTSVREGAAACLKKYVDDAEYPKFLRPESAEARKSVVRCMRDELKDLKAGDINLSDEDSD